MSGGGGTQKSETTFELSPEQRWFLEQAKPWFEKFAANPPTVDPRSGITPFNELQEQGQRMALGAVPGMSRLAGAAGAGNEFLTSGAVLRPETNPALQAHMTGVTNQLTRGATEGLLPALRSGYSTDAADFSSSRKDIGEHLIGSDTLRQIGDTNANIANTAYGQGLDAMTQGMALAPNVQSMQLAPGLVTAGVGQQQQSMEQALLSEALAKTREQQMLPASIGKEFLAALGAIPGGTTTSTTETPGASPLQTILGMGSLFTGIVPFFA